MRGPVGVAINEAILLRGTSGSAVATRQIRAALEESPQFDVRGVAPRWSRTGSRLVNASRDAHWDLRGAAAAAGRASVLVSPCNIGLGRRSQRHLLFVYDVTLWESPELFDPGFGAYARALIPLSMRRADLVLTLSRHAATTLQQMAPRTEIRVQALASAASPTATRASCAGTRPVVLCVGATAPNKNHIAALDAVAMLRSCSGVDVALTIVGPPDRDEPGLRRRMGELDPDGTWASRRWDLSSDELDRLYGEAWVLLQPSLNEGFGLPLVEAAQRGLPVLHSGRGGMAELFVGASVDSVDPEAFCDRLLPLLDGDAWAAASAYVSAESLRFAWPRVSEEMRRHVADLCGEAASPAG